MQINPNPILFFLVYFLNEDSRDRKISKGCKTEKRIFLSWFLRFHFPKGISLFISQNKKISHSWNIKNPAKKIFLFRFLHLDLFFRPGFVKHKIKKEKMWGDCGIYFAMFLKIRYDQQIRSLMW